VADNQGTVFDPPGCFVRFWRSGFLRASHGLRLSGDASPYLEVVIGELVIGMAGDAADGGRGVWIGCLFAEASEATPEVKGGLEEEGGAHFVEAAVIESLFDGAKVQTQSGQFVLVSGQESFLELFELDLPEAADLVLMFSVPFPGVDLGTLISREMEARLHPLARRAMKEESFGESCIGFESVEVCMSVDVVCFIHLNSQFFRDQCDRGGRTKTVRPSIFLQIFGSG